MPNQYTKAKELKELAMRQELAGIPDSRPPIAEKGEFEPNRVLDCHVGGVLVRDLPPQLQVALAYEQTDEGMLERDEAYADKLAAGKIAQIEFPTEREEERKRFAQMSDRLKSGAEPWECADPLKTLMDEHLPAGMKGRWLDPGTCDKLGMRGWTPVLDEDGDKVMCGQSFLGMMSKDRAAKRDKFFREKGEARMKIVQETIQEQVGQLNHAQARAGLPVGATGAPLPTGLQISRDLEELASNRQ